MKNLKVFFNIPSLLILMAIPAQAGRETGNGGDAIAIEFKTTALQVVAAINAGQTPMFPEVSTRLLQTAIGETKLTVKDHVFVNGAEKDAANYPAQKLIEISRTRWLSDSSRKQALVFHEYLGIMGVDDSNYAISSRLLNSLATPFAYAGPQNFSASCERGPIRLASECYPQFGVHIRDRYDEARDCATSIALSQCSSAGLSNCTFQSADNGTAIGNQCSVKVYVAGTKLNSGGVTPSNPIIISLRDSFSRAKAPTTADLKIGYRWSCKTFIAAGPTDDAFDKPPILFSLFGSFVKNVSPEKTTSDTSPIFYSFSSSSLSGSTPLSSTITQFYAIRVEANGNLVGEQSWLDTGGSATARLFPAALYDPSYSALSYFTCN